MLQGQMSYMLLTGNGKGIEGNFPRGQNVQPTRSHVPPACSLSDSSRGRFVEKSDEWDTAYRP